MKRIVSLASLSLEIVLLVGCSTRTVKRGSVQGCQIGMAPNADVGVVSAVPVPDPKLRDVYPEQTATMPAPPKEKLVGKWRSDMDCSSVVDTTVLSTGRNSYKMHEWKRRDEFEFFADGEYVYTEITGVDHGGLLAVGHKEKQSHGTWEYKSGVLTIHDKNSKGEKIDIDYKIRRYGEDVWEMRCVDVEQVRRVFGNLPGVESFDYRTSENGVVNWHVEEKVQLKKGEVLVRRRILQSPRVFKRMNIDE